MTPADRDAVVALAREVLAPPMQIDVEDPREYQRYRLAKCVLALAERPTCDWQPIETFSGPDKEHVLLWWPYWAGQPVSGYRRFGKWYAEAALSDGDYVPPTHWQPLPAPPSPLPSCSICRRDDCGGNHACE